MTQEELFKKSMLPIAKNAIDNMLFQTLIKPLLAGGCVFVLLHIFFITPAYMLYS